MDTEWKDPAWGYTDADDDTRLRDACHKLYEAVIRQLDAEADFEDAFKAVCELMPPKDATALALQYRRLSRTGIS